jgi:2-oxoglutarate ferredoxin oxidoreductase subunit alpha
MKHFTIAMGGEAGYGINSTGLTFSKIAVRSGYNIFNYFEYPSIIRGGHTLFRSTFSEDKLYSSYSTIDFLVAMNQDSMNIDTAFLREGGYVLYDSAQVKSLPNNVGKFHAIDVPLAKIATDTGSMLLRDTVVLGAVGAILGVDKDLMKEMVNEEYKRKDDNIREQNVKAIEAGYDFAVKNFSSEIKSLLVKKDSVEKKMVITGNEAASLGALTAGMQFTAIYPMTPITNILHTLAPLQNEYNFVYKQPEDEISAVTMAIGASFAGARSMTATSGGGYCLMTEAVGLAGITETPLVIIEGMRGGPSTGMPTWTEQPDLRFVLHGNHGEIPKIVLTASDPEDLYKIVFDAFNLADKYQTPVIVMIDKQICESHFCIEPFKNPGKIERGQYTEKSIVNYNRFTFEQNGISLRAPAGSENHVLANSDEHTEDGYTSEDAMVRDKMMSKRMIKMDTCRKEDMKGPVWYGPSDAKLTIVAWGSTKGAILEAMKELPGVNLLHFSWMSPFPSEEAKIELAKARKLLNIEGNYSAQFGGLLAEMTGIRIEDNLLKTDGRPFFPEELISEINKRLNV